MRSIDSSSLARTESIFDYTDEQASKSSDETMPVIADVRSVGLLESETPSEMKRTSIVTYGPIRVRIRHRPTPTLSTGRRSKYEMIEGEDVIKRQIRRLKNRESAKHLKRLRDNIEHELENRVHRLEFEGEKLLKQINSLRKYKQHLEQHQPINSIHQIIAETASAVLLELQRQQALQNTFIYIEPKQEPCPPSPEWQLSFLI